jgi:orotate phosphoribosyltransferase
MKEDILALFEDIGVIKRGHFKLSSGRHSDTYLQCAILQQYPKLNSIVMSKIAENIKDYFPSVILGAAVGGIIAAYELAKLTNARCIFAERVNSELKLRRGFEISETDKLIIVEDVITTAKTTLELVDLAKNYNIKPLALTTIVDRRESSEDLGYPVFSAIKTVVKTYTEEDCPLCKQGIQIDEPGSRRINK